MRRRLLYWNTSIHSASIVILVESEICSESLCYICTVSREPLHPLRDIDQPSHCGRYTVFHTRSNMRIYHEDRQASSSICPAPAKHVSAVRDTEYRETEMETITHVQTEELRGFL